MNVEITDLEAISEVASDNTLQETLDTTLENFRLFLCDTWTSLPEWMRLEEGEQPALHDWLQANWEILVEDNVTAEIAAAEPGFGKLRCYLEAYAQGGGSYSQSRRVSDPEALPTHEIHVGYGYRFDSFGTEQGDSFIHAPPFDYLMGINDTGESMWFKVNAVKYSIEKISQVDEVEKPQLSDLEKPKRTLKGSQTVVAKGAAYILGSTLAGALSFFLCQFLHPDSMLAALFFGSVFCLNSLVSTRPGQTIFLFLLLMVIAWLGFPHISSLERLDSLPRVLIGEVIGIIVGMTIAKVVASLVSSEA